MKNEINDFVDILKKSFDERSKMNWDNVLNRIDCFVISSQLKVCDEILKRIKDEPLQEESIIKEYKEELKKVRKCDYGF